jgi:hypothetical protein
LLMKQFNHLYFLSLFGTSRLSLLARFRIFMSVFFFDFRAIRAYPVSNLEKVKRKQKDEKRKR